MGQFTGIETFSTSNVSERQQLADEIAVWLEENPDLEIVDREVLQSSDATHHCLVFVFFYRWHGPSDRAPFEGAQEA